MLRVIAGEYKGRRLEMPKGIRPTRDSVREAVFNIIATHIRGVRVLDLFAGSGSLGIEAISRGAFHATFVDNARQAAQVIQKNLNSLMSDSIKKSEVLTRDAYRAIKFLHKQKESFNIIFIDPPYYKNQVKKCLKSLSLYDILAPSGFIIAEHSKRDNVPEEESAFKLKRQSIYSGTYISIYTKGD